MHVRRGWTLHEMIISLTITSAIVGLAVHAALGQMRFFRGAGEIAAVERQLDDVTGVVRGVVWGISPLAGDVAVALDTAIELRASFGAAIACESTVGRLVIPAPMASGNTLSAFDEQPQPDDMVHALLEDSTGSTWLTFRVAAAPAYAGACPHFPAAAAAWAIALREQIAIPEGSVLRFTRPLRLSVYRASDGRWYLGARDWNAEGQRFNTIQPVAGPLNAPGAADRSGLRFDYLDEMGEPLEQTEDPRRIRGIRVVARAASLRTVRVAGIATISGERFADSAVSVIALRNAR